MRALAPLVALAVVACAPTRPARSPGSATLVAPPDALAPGESAVVALEVRAPAGAHLSSGAPTRASLVATNLRLAESQLAREGEAKGADRVRFDVPVTAMAPGAASLAATVTLFVCTQRSCEREELTASVSLTVRAAASAR